VRKNWARCEQTVVLNKLFDRIAHRMTCAICTGITEAYQTIDGFDYFECTQCGSLQIDGVTIDAIDGGRSLVEYTDEYWANEIPAARSRSWSSSIARVAEVVRYTTIPINKFVDIGSGPGFLLDALATHLPSKTHHFYAYEAFPPPLEYRSTHPNYRIGFIGDSIERFDAGVCVEVLEHLTPNMARRLAEQLARVSNPGAVYLFNTGMPQYVKGEDPAYLDPLSRGHIVSYSLKAAETIFAPHGFKVHPLAGKTWAFLVEYQATAGSGEQGRVDDRVWRTPAQNLELLRDPQMGAVLEILGLESARAYW
jgi:SAM-dependent methyltransferase